MSFDRIEYAGLTFTDDEIVDGEIFRPMSLLYDALEIGTFTVELYIRDSNRGAALTAFRRNAKLLYYHRERLQGTYYVERVARTGKYTYEITANDALSLLDQSNHWGGIYAGQTVEQLVKEICNIPYLIQSKLKGIKLYGWLPIAARRSNLSQVLFAVGGVAKVDQNGVLRIETLWDGISADIPESRVFWGDRVNYATKVTEVSVLEHQYIAGAEEIKLFEGATVDGDLIQFSEPAHTLVAVGFTILEQGANYARVSGGSGTLTGLKYIHTTRAIRAAVAEDAVPNIVEVQDATLVSLLNSSSVAQRLAVYYGQMESVEHEVVYQDESPGDVVSLVHPYGGTTFGCITETAVTMGGNPVASEKIVLKYTPPQYEQSVTLENRIVLTGAGVWTVPENVTSLRVVLIGGGTGGQGGTAGGDGEDTSIIVVSDQHKGGGTWTAQPGEGGDGGTGGAGGGGGKVYQVEMDVVAGQAIGYVSGAGGQGGGAAAHGQEGGLGQAGGETTFGAFSSNSGEVPVAGFVDPITAEVFAQSGTSGVNGGDGGKGGEGNSSGKGENGEAVGANTGGVGATGNYRKWTHNYYSGSDFKASEQVRRNGGGGGGGATETMGGTNAPSYSSVGEHAGSGGTGAPGLFASDAPSFGSGGGGGNGGGGGGGAGGLYAYGEAFVNYTPEGIWMRPSGGAGGPGAKGASGASGCIIIYYGAKKTIASGQFLENKSRMVLYRFGRRLIV